MIELYYKNPNICKYCKSIINIGNQKVCVVRKKKFCNKSCSAKYNNKIYPKRKPDILNCIVCKSDFDRTVKTKRTHCDICLTNFKRNSARKIHGIFSPVKPLEERTKGELFDQRKNYQSARSTIRRHAAKVFSGSNSSSSCYICGYSIHVQVCHIKPVSSFKEESTLSEINDISNLIALCPNHHWEFDNGFLEI